jgi:hypothetical protein
MSGPAGFVVGDRALLDLVNFITAVNPVAETPAERSKRARRRCSGSKAGRRDIENGHALTDRRLGLFTRC